VVELVVRLVVSLTIVVGLMLLLAKLSMRRFQGRGDALVKVVHRQALSRSSSIAVVTVGSRVLVLGTTEQQVQLLTELDPEEIADADVTELPVAAAAEQDAVTAVASPQALATRSSYAAQGALAGSLLSASTWKQAFAAATSRQAASDAGRHRATDREAS
jgi:flagellar protein FliO/FliZ